MVAAAVFDRLASSRQQSIEDHCIAAKGFSPASTGGHGDQCDCGIELSNPNIFQRHNHQASPKSLGVDLQQLMTGATCDGIAGISQRLEMRTLADSVAVPQNAQKPLDFL